MITTQAPSTPTGSAATVRTNSPHPTLTERGPKNGVRSLKGGGSENAMISRNMQDPNPDGATPVAAHQFEGALTRVASLPRRVLRHYEGRAFAEQWFIALRPREPGVFPRSMDGFRVVSPPRGHFYADPFLVEWAGRHYVFFEEYSRDRDRGRIAYCEIRPDGSTGEPRIALERGSHLAYPFVFVYDSALYMIPETSDARSVELHRAPDFPGVFKLERVLLRGVNAVDTTFVVHQGRFWLLMNQFDRNTNPHSALHAYWSESFEGPWTPHTANPIVNDRSRARPGGRMFHANGSLIRPAQDCSRRYGEDVVFRHVMQLTPEVFAERDIGRIPGNWLPGNLGTHTYDRDSMFEVVDGRWFTSTRRSLDLTFRALSRAIDGPGVSDIRPRSAWRVPSRSPRQASAASERRTRWAS